MTLFENYLQREIDMLRAIPGVPIVRKFPFAFNTPEILTGAPLYTPNIGDILLDAWIEIDTAWDGVTPNFDVGTFIGRNFGWFGSQGPPFPLDLGSDISNLDSSLLSGVARNNTADNLQQESFFALNVVPAIASIPYVGGILAEVIRLLPAKFTADSSVKIVVSQDGTNIGADPGSTQGSAFLYLVTVTPV